MTDPITYTITTIAGSRTHVINGLAENLIIVRMIQEAFAGKAPGFILFNPSTFYTLANVISVSVEGGPPEVIEEVRRSFGFVADDDK